MNEQELKAAEKALKKKTEDLEKEIASKKEEFKKHVEETEKGFEERAKARDEEFEERLKATHAELEKEFENASRGIARPTKSSYRDSKFWKTEEGIALKVKQSKK